MSTKGYDTTAASQHQEASTDDLLRYVYIERPRCPVCGSADLRTLRSKDQGDGSVSRRTACQACGRRFFVIVE